VEENVADIPVQCAWYLYSQGILRVEVDAALPVVPLCNGAPPYRADMNERPIPIVSIRIRQVVPHMAPLKGTWPATCGNSSSYPARSVTIPFRDRDGTIREEQRVHEKAML
jgi:hypothetical protein